MSDKTVYIKSEDAIRAFREWLAISEATDDIIADLPTIEASEDCISREFLITSLEYCREQRRMDNPDWWVNKSDLLKMIMNAPSVVPSRPQGSWIDHQDEGYVSCPFCDSATTCDGNKDELKFCWHCGAKMKGGAE